MRKINLLDNKLYFKLDHHKKGDRSFVIDALIISSDEAKDKNEIIKKLHTQIIKSAKIFNSKPIKTQGTSLKEDEKNWQKIYTSGLEFGIWSDTEKYQLSDLSLRYLEKRKENCQNAWTWMARTQFLRMFQIIDNKIFIPSYEIWKKLLNSNKEFISKEDIKLWLYNNIDESSKTVGGAVSATISTIFVLMWQSKLFLKISEKKLKVNRVFLELMNEKIADQLKGQIIKLIEEKNSSNIRKEFANYILSNEREASLKKDNDSELSKKTFEMNVFHDSEAIEKLFLNKTGRTWKKESKASDDDVQKLNARKNENGRMAEEMVYKKLCEEITKSLNAANNERINELISKCVIRHFIDNKDIGYDIEVINPTGQSRRFYEVKNISNLSGKTWFMSKKEIEIANSNSDNYFIAIVRGSEMFFLKWIKIKNLIDKVATEFSVSITSMHQKGE